MANNNHSIPPAGADKTEHKRPPTGHVAELQQRVHSLTELNATQAIEIASLESQLSDKSIKLKAVHSAHKVQLDKLRAGKDHDIFMLTDGLQQAQAAPDKYYAEAKAWAKHCHITMLRQLTEKANLNRQTEMRFQQVTEEMDYWKKKALRKDELTATIKSEDEYVKAIDEDNADGVSETTVVAESASNAIKTEPTTDTDTATIKTEPAGDKSTTPVEDDLPDILSPDFVLEGKEVSSRDLLTSLGDSLVSKTMRMILVTACIHSSDLSTTP
jgi:hypothetical protein